MKTRLNLPTMITMGYTTMIRDVLGGEAVNMFLH